MLNLHSKQWPETIEEVRKMHLGALNGNVSTTEWRHAFDMLISAVKDERLENTFFAPEIINLTEETGISYDFEDILEEYFDHLEDVKEWDTIISSCDSLLDLFSWHEVKPSEYMYRKGNALLKSGQLDEAESFGAKWLSDYPDDLYGAASNAFLKITMGKLDEAEALTEKYMSPDLVCNDKTETLFMAAYRLYEMTDNINAKKRVEQKMAEYNALISK